MASGSLSNYRKQRRNANKHTPAGLAALDDSIRGDGWIGAMTVAADGETFDGSARLERVTDIMPDAEPIVVESDGTRPIIVKRTDIPNTDDPRAKRLGVVANISARIDYDPDAEILAAIAKEDDIVKRLVEQDSKSVLAIMQADGIEQNPEEAWRDMPEFEQEYVGSVKFIKVHFATLDDMVRFGELIGQKLTDKTKSIWYPKNKPENLKSFHCKDES